jgi:hypothetical protein
VLGHLVGDAQHRPEVLHRERRGQVALVVLHHQREALRILPEQLQVGVEVGHALQVRVEDGLLGVGDEDHAVDVAQHQPPGLVVGDLPRHRAQVQPDRVAPEVAQLDGQQVEEQGALGLRRQREQPPPQILAGVTVDVLEVGGLSPEPRTVVDDLEVHLLDAVVEDRHGVPERLPGR